MSGLFVSIYLTAKSVIYMVDWKWGLDSDGQQKSQDGQHRTGQWQKSVRAFCSLECSAELQI